MCGPHSFSAAQYIDNPTIKQRTDQAFKPLDPAVYLTQKSAARKEDVKIFYFILLLLQWSVLGKVVLM